MSTFTPQYDPVERLHAMRRRVVRIGLICCLVALAWAFWPHRGDGAIEKVTSRTSEDAIAAASAVRNIDPNVFDVALWTPPPAPVAKDVVAVAPPPPPIKFQLLGISGEGTNDSPLRAALYDPDTDRVILIGQGEKLSSFTVQILTNEAIELVDGTRVERLSLRDPAVSPTSGGGSR